MGESISSSGEPDEEVSKTFLTVKECQDVELHIMKTLHRYFIEYGLKYVMAYGTLLGAVRHKGFIPWDNDMDIFMPRPDYERFLRLVRDEPIADNLYLLHYSIDPRYHYQCARICDARTNVAPPYIREVPSRMGLWIDIFPLDGVWDSSIRHTLTRLELRLVKVLQRADIYAVSDGRGMKNSIKRLIHACFPNRDNRFQQRIDKLGSRFLYENSAYIGNVTEYDYFGECFRKEDLERPVLLPFEDTEFYAPRNWEDWLTPYYGDYMQLPPADKRITHDLRAHWAKGVD